MKNKVILILSIIAIVIFVSIGVNVKASSKGILFDEKVMNYIHSRITPLGIAIMKKITYFGSVYFFLPIGILIFFIMMKKKNINGRSIVKLN